MTVDDHALLRNGIRGLVNAEPDMKMIAEAATGVEAIKQFRQNRPDITLMDLQMPDWPVSRPSSEFEAIFRRLESSC